MDQLKTHIRAGYPLIQIVTNEEGRALAEIKRVAFQGLKSTSRPTGYSMWTWSVSTGLIDREGSPVTYAVVPPKLPPGAPAPAVREEMDSMLKSKDPINMLTYLMNSNVKPYSIIVLFDMHLFLKNANPMIIRLMKDAIAFGRMTNRHLVIVGCEVHRPAELEKELITLDLPLPDREELKSVVDSVCKSSNKTMTDGERNDVINAALGLTATEAASAMALSVVKKKRIDPKLISDVKVDTIRRNGILDVIDTKATQDGVGGLGAVKEWIDKRIRAFSPEAVEFGVPSPKGMMVIGVSGTGKSLVANTVATSLGVPMLRLEGSKIYNSFVGESERNMRTALHIADIMSPCVLFIDEIEKAMAGMAGGGKSLDSGVSARVVGTLLQWMNDKKSKVFVVATANDISQLPPEMLRRGRFDQIFFVDLPDQEEREQIWNIHIKRIKRNPADFDTARLASLTDGFTGAEVASIVDDGLINAFDQNVEPNTDIMANAIRETVPLSTTMKERIVSMRRWAETRALSASGKKINAEPSSHETSTLRKAAEMVLA